VKARIDVRRGRRGASGAGEAPVWDARQGGASRWNGGTDGGAAGYRNLHPVRAAPTARCHESARVQGPDRRDLGVADEGAPGARERRDGINVHVRPGDRSTKSRARRVAGVDALPGWRRAALRAGRRFATTRRPRPPTRSRRSRRAHPGPGATVRLTPTQESGFAPRSCRCGARDDPRDQGLDLRTGVHAPGAGTDGIPESISIGISKWAADDIAAVECWFTPDASA